jgi:hypothetical protein
MIIQVFYSLEMGVLYRHSYYRILSALAFTTVDGLEFPLSVFTSEE